MGEECSLCSGGPDWSREVPRHFWQPSQKLLQSLRAYQHWKLRPGIFACGLRKWATLRHRFWSVITGADIPVNCQIAGGLMLNHPNGVVIHPSAVIGANCLIFQQVTIGLLESGVPIIGNHVDIGAGAKILGAVHIGNHVKIGANAVVLCDIPSGATAVGIPARIIMPFGEARHGYCRSMPDRGRG
jgi:serine O-acetyltransferase